MTAALGALALGALAATGCAAAAPDAKVWSSSSSSDGYAACSSSTVVVGGGYEIVDALQVPGKLPHVVQSRPYANGWRVVCTDDRGAPVPGCKAWVVCASVLKPLGNGHFSPRRAGSTSVRTMVTTIRVGSFQRWKWLVRSGG